MLRTTLGLSLFFGFIFVSVQPVAAQSTSEPESFVCSTYPCDEQTGPVPAPDAPVVVDPSTEPNIDKSPIEVPAPEWVWPGWNY
jgi:hypothetical protein